MTITEVLACPECGSTNWTDYESCSETLRLRIYTSTDSPIWATEKSIWYETENNEGWKCENEHFAPEEIDERLGELRSELDFVT